MDSLLKSLAKTAALNVSFTREKYFQREFLRSTPSCRGIYSSFAEAQADTPRDHLAGYDHDPIAAAYKPSLDRFDSADYPVLFWLTRLLPEARLVFELGGSLGQGYYAYRRYLAYPPGLRWMVCDVAASVRAGEEIARERHAHQLGFTVEREGEWKPDIYATFGALQYIEEPFAAIIAQLRARPPHLLINRVPLTKGAAFITLQNNGSWFSPYQVPNKEAFVASLQALGYELVDGWEMPRPNIFLMEEERPNPSYCGMYLRLKSAGKLTGTHPDPAFAHDRLESSPE